MKSLCLNVELEGHDHQTIDVTHDPELDNVKADDDSALYNAIAADARKTEDEDASALDSIAAELGELMGETKENDTNDLIGKEDER